MRSALAFLRTTSTLTKAVVDGWQLVHVGLACVRQLRPETWIESFKMVNLHPHHRVSFDDWCASPPAAPRTWPGLALRLLASPTSFAALG